MSRSAGRFEPTVALAFRLVVLGVSAAWLYGLWKRGAENFRSLAEYPIHQDFFPSLLSSSDVLAWLYFTPLALGAVAYLWPRRPWVILYPAALLVSSAVLLLHPATFAVQGLNTSFWVALWLLWLALAGGEDPDESFLTRACFLAQLIVSFVFLGAALGKWTAGYASGEVLYHLVFEYQDFPQHRWLREHLDESGLRRLATVYSRLAVAVETALALGIFLPRRIAFAASTLALLGMWAMVTPGIVDALGPLIGLAGAGWLLAALQRPPEASCASS